MRKTRRKLICYTVCIVFFLSYVTFRGLQQLHTPLETLSYRIKDQNIHHQKNALYSVLINSNNFAISLGTSAKPFKAFKIRSFSSEKLAFRHKLLPKFEKNEEGKCKKWAVLTTIFEPSEALRRFLYLPSWCVVVVGDLDKPKKYNIPSSLKRRMIFLNHEDQKKMGSQFVDHLPWHSFSRKNIGFLFAISHGAEIIWDFDDDNMLKFWLENAAVDPNQWIQTFLQTKVSVSEIEKDKRTLFFNPYNYLGSKEQKIWPRGLPLKEIVPLRNQTFKFVQTEFPLANIGILQSLADHQPDVDAIYRLTEHTPFYFEKVHSKVKNTIILPHGLYSPMNAQATLHFQKAFFCLYLPVTVNGRVSDIWRSYIAEVLLPFRGLHVGFLPRPLVDQDRNVHNYEGDFKSEIPLYIQTSSFVSVLESWRKNITKVDDHKKRSLEDLMEDLYVTLYEWGFIEIDDVVNIQLWLKSINSVGYDLGLSNKRNTAKKPSGFIVNVGSNILSRPTGMPNKCVDLTKKKMSATFWTSDLHDGTRIDVPSLLSSLGQRFYIAGIKGSRSPYPEVFGRPGINIYGNLSMELKNYKTHSTPLSEISIKKNAEFYRDDSTFKSVDAFYCSFPASMCELWMPFNETKSILFLPSHRYNLGRCNVESWQQLNVKLHRLAKMKTDLGSKHVIGADNRYDYEYLYHYTGIKSLELISSFSGFYTEKAVYNPTKKEILAVFVKGGEIPPVLKDVNFNVTFLFHKYIYYTLNDLTSYPAVIFIPYSVHSFKITELYSLNIPLFVPSLKYFRQNGGLGSDRTSTSAPYCQEDKDLWRKMKKHPSSYHSFNPNAEFRDNPEDEMYWLQFSDFYDWPHIQYFDDKVDLERKMAEISEADLIQIHQNMRKENEIRKYVLLNKWCDIIPKIKHK
ncbi:uncharacterized protein LOC134260708 [Saccostrea cucullata]|uniref:uncharacterized protein LOC134260708 n=1 Tax=Saccostrea cuccullata TaxID=36930 RepID=UPI002ED2349E